MGFQDFDCTFDTTDSHWSRHEPESNERFLGKRAWIQMEHRRGSFAIEPMLSEMRSLLDGEVIQY
jgi:hypothetical protein